MGIICEFEFDDEKTGTGYFYYNNSELELTEETEPAETEPATEEATAEQDPETGLWKFVDPPADWQRILVTIRSQNGENDPFVQEDVWYENGYDLLESGYTPCVDYRMEGVAGAICS